MLLDLIKHFYKGSGIGVSSHQRAVSLYEFAYLCRLIDRSNSLLSSMKILAVDALIIVKLLSHTDTHCGLAERSIIAQKHAHTHTHTHPFPVEFVSSMTCFPTQQHLPRASNKTQIKD